MGHPELGSRVSHYQLVRKLGSGGMGEVYLAQDLQLDRLVAIKFLNTPTDERARRRLLREAQSAAALDHPLICGVHEVGSDPAGGDFIVMQYVQGETLALRLTRGRLPPAEALTLGSEIAEALAAAHRHGIVHRDLKPQNIIITPEGRPTLLDFGISKRVVSAHDAAEADTATQLTQPHAMMGSPGYMAPEQIQGRPSDFRSDLFALGCVLYEGLTGRRAFSGATTAEVFGQVLHVEPPPLSSIVPELGGSYEAFVSRLLRKSPADRFQSAEEVLGAIRTLKGDTGFREATPASTVLAASPVRRSLIAAGVLIGVAIAAWSAFDLWQGRALPAPPPGAVPWYEHGVEALRDGTYAGARAALEEAVRLYPEYAQAYSRLAEAHSELDDERAAQAALLRVSAIVPDMKRLRIDERLRLEAVRDLVLREYDQAIGAYRQLLARHPDDAGVRLDIGRAEEAAGRIGAAREHYAKAVELDPQYAAAHLRLGVAEGHTGQPAQAIIELDEAIRLYHAASRAEGEAEALLRKGMRQSSMGDFAGARQSLERAAEITADSRNLSQRVRIQFQLARVTLAEGRFADAQAMAAEAVADATSAGVNGVAAEGLVDVANSLTAQRQYEDANAQLERAIHLASDTGATRTEMRARLQQASLRLRMGRPEDTIVLAQEPIRFYAEGHYRYDEAQAKNIVSRAHGDLEQYEEGGRLAREALQYGESVNDAALMSVSLENLASQLTRLGTLPEALRYRERSEQIHRTQGRHSDLKFDLPNRAELLIQLGRGTDAESVLEEVDQAIASGLAAYADRTRRVAQLRALRAATEHRFASVPPLADAVTTGHDDAPDRFARLAEALHEYARARMDRSRTAPATIAKWIEDAPAGSSRLEASYWVARTLLARREPVLALTVVADALSAPAVEKNVELRWRLNAVAARCVAAGARADDGVDYAARTSRDVAQLEAEWGGDATTYFARPDLAELLDSR